MNDLVKKFGPVCAVIGAQWGDEGKGKLVDMLAEQYDVIARACGGANAGHTIVVDGKKHVFHLLPSGCMHEEKVIFLGSGMVIHLPTLLEEIETLREAGIDVLPRLHISSAAHIVFEYHKAIDAALEEKRSSDKDGKIGTTKRGIGPCYMNKAERIGLRMQALLWDDTELKEYLQQRVEMVEDRYGVQASVDKELLQITTAKRLLKDCIVPNGPAFLNKLRQEKHSILIEGAQATLLDIDHGTYPYVTSSSTTLAGALQGIGLPPQCVTACIGVAKAYCTRVGAGTFPTEIEGKHADRLRERGGEYGATTGRPRRCGWLDVADLQYAAMINGCTHWNITKLDVLDEEPTVPVSVQTSAGGNPTYKDLEGWEESTAGMTEFSELPKNAQKYIEFIEKETKVPVALIGTGQGREEMILR